MLAIQTQLQRVTLDGTLYNVNFDKPKWGEVTLKGKVEKVSCEGGTIEKLTLDGTFSGVSFEGTRIKELVVKPNSDLSGISGLPSLTNEQLMQIYYANCALPFSLWLRAHYLQTNSWLTALG